MELDEAVARLLRRHAVLILVTVLIAVGAALAMHRHDTPQYAASARVLLTHQTVSSDAEATAIIGRASALATSRSVVAAAINATKVDRDPVVVARDEVVLDRVGLSSVGRLTVTDPDPEVAAKLTNAIASRVVNFLTDTDNGDTRAAIAGVDQQLTALQAQRAVVAASLAHTTDPLHAATLQGNQQALDRQIGDLSAQRSQIMADDALRPRPEVVDTAVAPLEPLPSKKVQDVALGGLLGVLLGLGMAGVAEVIRPTVAGARAVSRRLEVPLLGSLPGGLCDRRHRDDPEFAAIVLKLRIVAARTGASSVLLLGDRDESSLVGFAARVDEQLARSGLAPAAGASLVLSAATAGGDVAVSTSSTLLSHEPGAARADGSGQLLMPPPRAVPSTPNGLLVIGSLAGVEHPRSEQGLAVSSNGALTGSSSDVASAARPMSRPLERLRVHTLRTLPDDQLATGDVVAVAVCATVLPQRQLDEVTDSLAAVGAPLAGVLTYRNRRLRRPTRPRRGARKEQRP